MSGTTLTPAAFIGHGSPMNALESNRYTSAWREFGRGIPRPSAVLVISAHWYVDVTAVTAMAQPRTIHDFFGFPAELLATNYPAPGSPHIAAEVAELLKPVHVDLDLDSWGLDHGAWSVLVHVLPKADVPVVQLSINARRTFFEHFELGMRLAPLLERGVLILGSGNLVHNLRAIDWAPPDTGFDWAHRFNESIKSVVTENPERILDAPSHADFATAVPTPDHFIPLLYLAGLAYATGHPLRPLIDGYTMGSLSMASYTLDATILP